MRTWLPLLGVSLFSSALTFAGAMLAFPPAGRAEPVAQPLPVVQAQRFDLLDANGTLRARLGVEADNDSAGLTVFDSNGQARASIALGGDTAVVQTLSPQGGRATLSALPTGVVGVGMVDPNGASRAGIGLAADGSPVVEVGRNLQSQPSARASNAISRQAVNHLTSIGGGGPTAALTGPLLRLFNNFSYRRLGMGCHLHNNICDLRGLEDDAESVLILEGSGVPKIMIRAYNRRMDFPQLVANLAAASSGEGIRIGDEDVSGD